MYSRQYNICVLRVVEDIRENRLPLWLVNGKPNFLKTITSLFATSNRMLAITKPTILKELWTVCRDSRSVISWSLHSETEVNPTYSHHLGLRWFSHLLYTCQNQCNKSLRRMFFFSQTNWLSADIDAYWQMRDPVFSKASRQKVPEVQSYLFLACAMRGLEEARCMITNAIWLLTCSESQSQNVLCGSNTKVQVFICKRAAPCIN